MLEITPSLSYRHYYILHHFLAVNEAFLYYTIKLFKYYLPRSECFQTSISFWLNIVLLNNV